MSAGRWIALIETDTGSYYLQALVPSVALEPFFLISVSVAFTTVVAVAVAFYYFHTADGFDQTWDDKAKKLLNQDEKTKPVVKKPVKDKNDKIQKQKLREINLERYHSRMSSIVDLEPEYAAFLAGLLSKLNSQIAQLTDSITSVQSSKAAIEAKMEDHKNSRVAAENKVSELKTSMTELNGKIQKLNTSRAELQTVVTTLQNENKTLVSSLDKAKEEIERMKHFWAKSKEDLSEAKSEIKKLTSSLESSENEKVDLIKQVQTLKIGAQELQLELSTQKGRDEALEKKIDELETSLVSHKSTIEGQLESLQLEKSSSTVEKERLVRLHAEEKRVWNEEEVKLQAEVDQTRFLLAKIEQEMTKFEEAKDTSLKMMKDGQEELMRKCEEMKVKNNELTEKCKQLEEDKLSLEEQISVQSEKMDQLATLEKRNAILEKLVNDLRKPADSNAKKLQEENEQLQSLNDELSAKNQELAKKAHDIESTRKETSIETSEDGMAGDSRQEAQKLKDTLTRLNGLKEKVKAEKDSIDTIKETVQEVMDSLVNEE